MNAKARGLGKGLGALIPPPVPASPANSGATATSSADTSPVDTNTGAVYREIPLELIEVNPLQPRRHFEAQSLADLTSSITMVGVLQPIVVRPTGSADYFEIIAGERRWRAAKQAGIATIPAVIKNSDDEATLVNAIIENAHREDLNALEEAAAYQQLIDDFGLTHAQVGERLGKSRTTVTNSLRLLSLPTLVQQLLLEKSLTAGHARALLSTDDQDVQEQLATQAAEQEWSVRTVEQAVKASQQPAKVTPKASAATTAPASRSAAGRSAAALEIEAQLGELLATEVSVKMTAGAGQIQIRFADAADLARIYAILDS